MSYMVTAEVNEIKIEPQTIVEEVMQNLAMILATRKGSVPFDRDLGLSQTFLDAPSNVAKALIVSEIIDEIGEYEPRASVESVEFKLGENAGSMIPVVKVNVNER